MKKILLVMASAAILAVPFAGPAAADDAAVCEVGVYIHKYPGVGWIWVETGQYEPYQNCTSEPPIVITRDPICLQKPPICV